MKNLKMKTRLVLAGALLSGLFLMLAMVSSTAEDMANQNENNIELIQLADNFESPVIEGKCGDDKSKEGDDSKEGEKAKKDDKSKKESKCGEGKCGDDKAKAKEGEKDEKAKEGEKESKCGEGKCGEGKCGEGKCG